MGSFGTCDIFTRHSGVLMVGAAAATRCRMLHVMEHPQKDAMDNNSRIKYFYFTVTQLYICILG